jgi:hypothetical protein
MLNIIKLIKNRPVNELYIFSFLIIYWFFIWSSIGVEYKSILNFGKNFIELINFFRINIALILSGISIFILIYIIFKKKIIKNYQNILILFNLYFFFQFIGLILNQDLKITLGNCFLLILGIGTINIFLYLKIYNYENFSKVLLYVSLIFCTIFVFFIFILNLDKMMEYLVYSTFYSLSLPSDRLLDNAYPRSTGLSRLFAVANIFFIALFLKYFSIKKKLGFLIIIFIILFGVIIWGFQSRGTIISYFSAILIIIFLFNNEKKTKFLNFFLIVLLPIVLFYVGSNIAKNIYVNEKFNIYLNYLNELKDNNKEEFEIKYKEFMTKNAIIETTPGYYNRFVKKNNITSGRTEIWQYVISNYDKKKIFGYGVQGDRYLLGKKYGGYGNNSSNVFVYFFVSGGYLSILILMLILLRILIILLKIYFQKDYRKTKETFIFKLCLMLIIFFSVRGLVENSYGLFSVDFLLFTNSIFILENLYNKSINNKKY